MVNPEWDLFYASRRTGSPTDDVTYSTSSSGYDHQTQTSAVGPFSTLRSAIDEGQRKLGTVVSDIGLGGAFGQIVADDMELTIERMIKNSDALSKADQAVRDADAAVDEAGADYRSLPEIGYRRFGGGPIVYGVPTKGNAGPWGPAEPIDSSWVPAPETVFARTKAARIAVAAFATTMSDAKAATEEAIGELKFGATGRTPSEPSVDSGRYRPGDPGTGGRGSGGSGGSTWGDGRGGGPGSGGEYGGVEPIGPWAPGPGENPHPGPGGEINPDDPGPSPDPDDPWRPSPRPPIPGPWDQPPGPWDRYPGPNPPDERLPGLPDGYGPGYPGGPGDDGGHADGGGYGYGEYGAGYGQPGYGTPYGAGGYASGYGSAGYGGSGGAGLGGYGSAAGGYGTGAGAFGSGSYGSAAGVATTGVAGGGAGSSSQSGMPMMGGGQGGGQGDKKKGRKNRGYIAPVIEEVPNPFHGGPTPSALRAGHDGQDFSLPDIEDPEDQW